MSDLGWVLFEIVFVTLAIGFVLLVLYVLITWWDERRWRP